MTGRRVALVCAAAALVGFASGAAGVGFPAAPDTTDVVVYEDGAGVQYIGDQEVRTFPVGTFVWDCRAMGDRMCFDPADARAEWEQDTASDG